jgi:hypothetical protein
LTKQQNISVLGLLSVEQQVEWLVDFGMLLTVAARNGYPRASPPGSLEHLMAFNEMQHAVYGAMQHLPHGTAWPMEQFLEGLLSRARQYGVEGDLGWALRVAVERLGRRTEVSPQAE